MIKVYIRILIHIIGGMGRDINAGFSHNLDGFRVNPMSFYAGAINLGTATCEMP